jgi:hypothetical protein
MFLTPTDFTGKYELHTGMYDTAKLQSYIDKYEVRYLRELLGVTLYNEFVSDLTIQYVPKSPNFLQLYNPFAEDVNMYQMLESDGMLEMLKGFIYFEYSKDLMMQQTTYGGVQQTAENSKVLNTLQSLIYNRYNEAVRTYRAIQDYILLNTTMPTNQVVEISQWSAGTGYFADDVNAITMSKSAKVISLTSGGTGYTTGLKATTGGSGSGLSVNITAIGGIITFASIEVAGIGYSIGDVVAIAGGVGGTITITDVYPYSIGAGCEVSFTAHSIGGVANKSIVSGGTLYVTSPTQLNTTGGSGSGCKVTIVATAGIVTAITIAVQGTGYTVGDTLTIIAGVGSGATFLVTQIYNGEINVINITEGGINYELGDFLGVPRTSGLNGNARYEVTYIGKGHYGDFKGQIKRTAYWI